LKPGSLTHQTVRVHDASSTRAWVQAGEGWEGADDRPTGLFNTKGTPKMKKASKNLRVIGANFVNSGFENICLMFVPAC